MENINIALKCVFTISFIALIKSVFLETQPDELQELTRSIFKMLREKDNFTQVREIQMYLTMQNSMDYQKDPHYQAFTRVDNVTLFKDDDAIETAPESLKSFIEDYLNEGKLPLDTEPDTNTTIPSLNLGPSDDHKKEMNKCMCDHKNEPTKKNYPQKSTEKYNVIDIWRNLSLNSTRRLIKSHRAKVKDFPFVASIHVMGRFACAGAIISDDLVITAASCLQIAYNNRFFRENPQSIHVRVGSDYIQLSGELVPIVTVYFHPSYDSKSLNNNIAIARMERALNFKKKRVKRIEYDRTPGKMPYNVGQINLFGWGAKASDTFSPRPKPLRFAELQILDLEDCHNMYKTHSFGDKQFCAGFMVAGYETCNRDVGSPGVVDNLLMGLVTFGSPVCDRAHPTSFTKIGFYTNWIDQIVSMDSPRHLKKYKDVSLSNEDGRKHRDSKNISKGGQGDVMRSILNPPTEDKMSEDDVNDLIYGASFDDGDIFESSTQGIDILPLLMASSDWTLVPTTKRNNNKHIILQRNTTNIF